MEKRCRRSRPADLPDVVVIVVDTLRRDRLPFYDPERKTAPFLDTMARQGMVFDNAWSSSSWTAPATASIFTGRYPNQHGVRTGIRAAYNRSREVEGYELNRIPDQLVILPAFMKAPGRATAPESERARPR